jgi:hypothetical protein
MFGRDHGGAGNREEGLAGNGKNNGEDEIRGSLHYGGKSAASGRDDDFLWRVKKQKKTKATA